MKYLYLISAILIFSINVEAQKKINVSESTKGIANGNNNALIVNIFEADQKLVEKEWTKLMKDNKAKVSGKKEIFADDAVLTKVSANTVDVYAQIEEVREGEINLIVAFDLGGAFISSKTHSAEYSVAKDMLYTFAVNVTKEALRGKLKDEEKNLEKLEKDLSNLQSDKKSLEKDIENYKEKIKQAEKDIETNTANQETKTKEIATQKDVVKTVVEKEKTVK